MSGSKDGSVKRVAARRYWREADARVVVEAWRGSGEGLGEFARRYGFEPRRMRRWAERLERLPEPVRMHPVRVVEREDRGQPSDERLEIVLDEGCSVRVPPGFAAEDLERVLSVLAVGA